MKHDDKLPNDLLWAEDGHASEVAITTLADGQEALLPPELVAHVYACFPCTEQLGAAALLSLSVGETLAHIPDLATEAARTDSAPSSVSRRLAALPLRAVAAAIGLAALGALPTLAQVPAQLTRYSADFTRSIPLFTKSGLLVLRGLSGHAGPLWFTVASAAILMATAVAVTRALPALPRPLSNKVSS